MHRSIFTTPFIAAASLAAAAAVVSGDASAQSGNREIVVTITHVRAIDKMDVFSKGDFYGRVTIDGETQKTAVAKQQEEIKPGWTIAKRVAAGKHDIKLEILDKDVSVDDPVDINTVANKRHQDFTIDTKTCRITGFSGGYRCGSAITRKGSEKKAAEISFKVEVKTK